jgi:anhydro-N-acetylmuramic acid kinase
MVYKAIGIMSGSSLDGLDMAYVHFQEIGGKWNYELLHSECYPYTQGWKDRLKNATSLSAIDYQLLHTAYGHYIGEKVSQFIDTNGLHHKVDLISSHGHTTFHLPKQFMTAQVGDGAAIAAETALPVISDLRAMDLALGGQGAPIVPIGEQLLLGEYDWFLNLGGIANLSYNGPDGYIAFDVCPANRVLNMLAQELGKEYDENGASAAAGTAHPVLLERLNALEYYRQPWPKSLANDFGTGVVHPLIKEFDLSVQDALCTVTTHIAQQVGSAVGLTQSQTGRMPAAGRLLVAGGGALNGYLVARIREHLTPVFAELVVPGRDLINFKEAIIMALIGVLRWREEYNVLASVTGAKRNSIGGAVWMGNEA